MEELLPECFTQAKKIEEELLAQCVTSEEESKDKPFEKRFIWGMEKIIKEELLSQLFANGEEIEEEPLLIMQPITRTKQEEVL